MGVHRRLVRKRLTPLALLLAVWVGWADAEEIYRCVVDGKIGYTHTPPAGGDCRPARLPATDPSPEEVARALERKEREKAEEEAAEAAARERQRQELELRAVQAQERAATAADRRARAAEQQLRRLQEQPLDPYSRRYYPIIVPGIPSGQFVPKPRPRPDHPLPPAPAPERPTEHKILHGIGPPPKGGAIKGR